jgi:small subunit ribosomal protein S16
MLRIRLARVGLKRQPTYRIVINERERARDSRYQEAVGFYNPRTQPETVTLKEDRVLYWLSVGAQPSESVAQILTKTGTLDRFARLRAGETMEALVAESQAARESTAQPSPKTRYPAPVKSAKNLAAEESAAE